MSDNPIITSVDHELHLEREKWLRGQLQKALDQPFIKFSDLVNIKDQGIYMIYDDDELLYVGMTLRRGGVRIKEIAMGYRKHTFNRKRLAEYFRNLGTAIHVLSVKNFKRDWIDNGILTLEQIKDAQKSVNLVIRQTLRYKFYETRYTNINFLEHYAIATLQPLYND